MSQARIATHQTGFAWSLRSLSTCYYTQTAMTGPRTYTISVTTGNTPILKNALLLLSGAVAMSVYTALRRRMCKKKVDTGRSTTSSAGGGVSAYETRKAVDEYLQFHYGKPEELLPYEVGPKEALQFAARLATLCERHTLALQDFTGEQPETIALDVGCAVGGASFELARSFQQVLGIDYSQHFVNAARTMRDRGWMRYMSVEEASITAERTAAVAEDIDRDRVTFMQGDACNLPSDLPAFDAVLAANLLCRLPDPMRFLDRAPSIVKPGGVLVLVSPYSWLEAWTPQQHWLGGFYGKDGQPVWSSDALKKVLGHHFELVAEEEVPFLIREHRRKYQWGISHAMIWRRR